MHKITFSVCIFGILLSCNSPADQQSNLLGKWEAEYMVKPDQDTIFYEAGSISPCAYIILHFDYNSGFELKAENKGDLIWCGKTKEQFFTWTYQNDMLTATFEDKVDSVMIQDLTDSTMQLTVNTGEKYQMKKY